MRRASSCSAACSHRSRSAAPANTTTGGTTCSTPIAASRRTKCRGVAAAGTFRGMRQRRGDATTRATTPRVSCRTPRRHRCAVGRRTHRAARRHARHRATGAAGAADRALRHHLRHRRHHPAKQHHRLEDRRAAHLPATTRARASRCSASRSCTPRCRPARRTRNPIFYVSSSPWNLYDLLDDFLELNAIPAGPIFLRDIGTDTGKFIKTPGHGHKLERARTLIARNPQLRWVLLGDSGQADAELYAEAAQEFGDRIAAIYIRDVDPDADSPLDTRRRRLDREGRRHQGADAAREGQRRDRRARGDARD